MKSLLCHPFPFLSSAFVDHHYHFSDSSLILPHFIRNKKKLSRTFGARAFIWKGRKKNYNSAREKNGNLIFTKGKWKQSLWCWFLQFFFFQSIPLLLVLSFCDSLRESFPPQSSFLFALCLFFITKNNFLFIVLWVKNGNEISSLDTLLCAFLLYLRINCWISFFVSMLIEQIFFNTVSLPFLC